MIDPSYGRMRDLAFLVDLVHEHSGEKALEQIFARQFLPLDLSNSPDAVIPIRDIIAIYRNASEVCGVRSFGLQAADNLRIENFGPFGNFVLQAPDLRGAIFRLQRALPLYESGSRLILEEANDECFVGYENTSQTIAGYRQAGDMTIRVIEGVIKRFVGIDWQPLRVHQVGNRGPWYLDYEDAFSAPVLFRRDQIGFVLERRLLSRTRGSEKFGQSELVTFADLHRAGRELPSDFIGIVANLVERNLSGGQIDLNKISASLALGARTLQRRLEDHGMTYRRLVTTCRMRRAAELLTETQESIERVGRETGYSNASHFVRAFKNAYGVTPNDFRTARYRALRNE